MATLNKDDGFIAEMYFKELYRLILLQDDDKELIILALCFQTFAKSILKTTIGKTKYIEILDSIIEDVKNDK